MYAYVHIPFCRRKCPYCRFALTTAWQDVSIERYVSKLIVDIRTAGNTDDILRSVYFGGGTPSVLSIDQISRIIEAFHSHYTFAEVIEITLEANPEDITEEWTHGIQKLGVNRLSLGIQSLIPETLAAIHRADPATIHRALETVSKSAIPSINADWIIGLPHSQRGDTVKGIQKILETYRITHTSLYLLEDHEYPKDWQKNSLSLEERTDEYGECVQVLKMNGLEHYEISNFARKGFHSRHNSAYWDHSKIVPFGLAASGFDGRNTRTTYSDSFTDWYSNANGETEILSAEQIRLEKIMFGLRTFSLDPALVEMHTLQKWIDSGHLVYHGNMIAPTLSGIFILDHILSELV